MFRITSSVAVVSLALANASPALAEPKPPAIESVPITRFVDPAAIPLPAPPTNRTEQWEMRMGERIVRNVTAPTLTPILPDPAKATGTAVIVAPGGGFLMLAVDNEGYPVARWLASHGIAAFVLKYRLQPTPTDPAGFTQAFNNLLMSASKSMIPTPTFAMQDAQSALRLVRARAAEWHIDPHRVGMLGFSAGAMTTMGAGFAAHPNPRPDFMAPIYGPMSHQPIPADAPPMFAALAADDPLMSRGGYGLVADYRTANRPIEFHLFEAGGHGFGITKRGTTSDMWAEEFYRWMLDRGLLDKSKAK